MSGDKTKQTTINISEKANVIWEVATHLSGLYKPHEYGKVILPMTVIKRFNDTLLSTHEKVLAMNKQCDERGIQVKDGFLQKAAGHKFYNTSVFTLDKLLDDADNIEDNFRSYLNGFSDNVQDILENFEFDKEITKMSKGNALYIVIQEFCSEKAYMGADKVSSVDMGYVFEELVRKFSESYDEQAGAHFTARDIIYLMTDLLIAGDKESLKQEVVTKTVYDMTMGTSQMLGCLTERIQQINPDADVTCFGQEFNPETFAIAKADMLIKDGNADNMKFGDTLVKQEFAPENVKGDQFENYEFDYIISNPPFGIDWKKEKDSVEAENRLGDAGRFGAGLPPISDGQMLFMLNGVKKLKDNGRMAIIQNGSPLFSGDAGSGQSDIRGLLLENDWLEAIVQMPTDMFYNTGISTYIWLVTKEKSPERVGKVQLIDASIMFEARRKCLGNKRRDFSQECIEKIVMAYNEFQNKFYDYGEKSVESKIFDNEDFKYTKVVVETPLKDEKGNVVLDKKGSKQPNTELRDSEIIPFKQDIEEYMQKNVYPFNPDAYIDESKTKVGYEIPFTRQFYKYIPPKASDEIFSEIKQLEAEETKLMKELFGND